MTAVALSVVVPVYNEAAVLEREVTNLHRSLTSSDLSFEIILVENGSTDMTRKLCEKLAQQPLVTTVSLPHPSYGRALKEGILRSRGVFVGLINIDWWDVQFLKLGVQRCESGECDIVVGSKTMSGAHDSRPYIRRTITRLFNWFLRSVFTYRGTDTHGMKVLNRQLVLPLVQQTKTEREVFDTELLLRAQRAGLRRCEVPTNCEERRASTYGILRRVPRTLHDLWILHRDLKS